MAIEQKKLRQFKCNSCGGELELQNTRTRYVSCPYCGSVAVAQSDAFKILTKNENPTNFSPRTFLKLGLRGKINNQIYKIIGRTSWKSDYKEYWSDEDGSGYSDEVWTFDEWLLIGEDATYLSIIEDQDGYSYTLSYTPKYPSLPSGTQINSFNDNSNQRVAEYGDSEILYFEGESTYLVKPGDKVGFSQYSKGSMDIMSVFSQASTENGDYIAEWRYDENRTIKEIEFFKETPVSKAVLLKSFASDDLKQELEEKFEKKLKLRKTNKRIFLYGGLLNLIVGIILAITYSSEKGFESVYSEGFYLQNYVTTNKFTVLNDSTKSLTATGKKKLIIRPEDKEIIVTMNSTIEDEFEIMFHLKLLNSSNNVVFERSIFAYDYKSYKNGEAAIAEGSFSEIFTLDNINDEYTLQLTFDVPKNYEPVNSKRFVDANVEIQKRGINHDFGFFFFFGIIMLIISLFIFKPKNKYKI